jgi:hypothetical protein
VSGIRPVEREDLPQVAGLFELVMRSGSSTPLPQLVGFFERTLFDNPWADPEIPSFVYVDDGGEIVGLICSNPRRMRFDGRPTRMACSAYLITHPRAGKQVVGALLMRACLAGPQDLTITDGATETVRRMWEALGGRTVHLSCLSFIWVFRPWQLAGDHLLHGRAPEPLESALRPAWSAFDWVSAQVARRTLVPHAPEATVAPLTPSKMLEYLPAVTASLRLHADYDRPYLEWLFGELEEVSRWGPIQPRLVRRGSRWAELVRKNGRVVGWYVCHLRRSGFCRLLQLAATEESADTVFEQLAYRAREQGATGVYGRIEPRLVGPLSRRRCLIRFGEGRLLVHSKHEGILDAILSGDALLTRLDGEWW